MARRVRAGKPCAATPEGRGSGRWGAALKPARRQAGYHPTPPDPRAHDAHPRTEEAHEPAPQSYSLPGAGSPSTHLVRLRGRIVPAPTPGLAQAAAAARGQAADGANGVRGFDPSTRSPQEENQMDQK